MQAFIPMMRPCGFPLHESNAVMLIMADVRNRSFRWLRTRFAQQPMVTYRIRRLRSHAQGPPVKPNGTLANDPATSSAIA
jgi:hypothetical protein